MTDQSWEALSNQFVAVCGVALLPRAARPTSSSGPALRGDGLPADGGGRPPGGPAMIGDGSGGDRSTAMFGRSADHGVAVVLHSSASAAAWPRTPTGCRGATCTSSPSAARSWSRRSTCCCASRFRLAGWRRSSSASCWSLLMLAVIWLYEPVAPLTEALFSPWLVIHVVSAIIATGAFTLGRDLLGALPREGAARDLGQPTGYLARVPEPAVLDRLSYRLHAFAFPVWTFAVLITGPIWAHQAWSSTGTGTPRRSGRSSPGSSTRPTSTPARPPAGRAATPRSWRWSGWRRCGSTSSGSTSSSQHEPALVRRWRGRRGRRRAGSGGPCRGAGVSRLGRERPRTSTSGGSGSASAASHLNRRRGSGDLGGGSGSSGCFFGFFVFLLRSHRKSGSSSGPSGRGSGRRGAGLMPRRSITRTVR